MKFYLVLRHITEVRCVSHASKILVCCCVAIVLTSSAPAVDPRSLGWAELSPANSPPARSYFAMAYDPVSGKIIAFGGDDGIAYLNDTWTFDGINWTEVAAQPAPPPRTNAQMTSDSVSRKVVHDWLARGRK